jgi:hypothetical protein
VNESFTLLASPCSVRVHVRFQVREFGVREFGGSDSEFTFGLFRHDIERGTPNEEVRTEPEHELSTEKAEV